ncbi:hypothetical protein [Planomicrobium sp. CPCC 101079]|nr:hypothetical protein [Planomicrobium sp. CPCC 101079]
METFRISAANTYSNEWKGIGEVLEFEFGAKKEILNSFLPNKPVSQEP